MCGIFAYNGKENSIPFLVEGLRNLEYRGYDSAGVLGVSPSGDFFLEKSVGKVSNLATKIEQNSKKNDFFPSGIAHTRWATHGGVLEKNTHPHFSTNKRFFVVHNGIIENYMEIKKKLEKKGFSFYSDTDTEIIAKLVEDIYDGDLFSTIQKVTKEIIGAYAIAIIDIKEPDLIVGAKLGSPMVLGIGKDSNFLSSDTNAISKIANEFIILEDYEIVKIKGGKYNIFSFGKEITRGTEKMQEEYQSSSLGHFKTFTEKEIHEIPEIIMNTFKGRLDFENLKITNETIDKLNNIDIEKVEIIASGSSYFAGLTGSYYMKEIGGIPCEVRISSEFLYDTFIPNKKTLYIFMSQSGETADARECVKIVKEKKCLTFGIVNVVGSTIARMCEMGLYTHSGIEVGVASTKNVITQIAVLLIMAINFGLKRNLQIKDAKNIIGEIKKLPEKILTQLENKNQVNKIIEKYYKYENFFFLGRNLLYGTAQECSLKLKELSYLHSEAYSAGELKHGPLALISEKFPCIVLNPEGIFEEKTISNIKEIKARNGIVIGIITKGNDNKELYDDYIEIPKIDKILTPFLCLIPMWLFAVGVAKKLGRDIDKPQNLAKSVTVE